MPPNPPESSVDDYMARLAAQLKSLPASTREEHLRELRQHIEQLVAAHADQPDAVSAALLQMGNAKQVGSRLTGEWLFQHTQNSINGFLFFWGMRSVVALLLVQWLLHIQNTRPFAEWGGTHFIVYKSVEELAVVLASSICVGWFAPGCAFRVAFYGWLWFSGLSYAEGLSISWHDISFFHNGYFYNKNAFFTTVLNLLAPLMVLASFALQCGVAYLVSAYRRGELYSLRRADFRIPFSGALRWKLARRK